MQFIFAANLVNLVHHLLGIAGIGGVCFRPPVVIGETQLRMCGGIICGKCQPFLQGVIRRAALISLNRKHFFGNDRALGHFRNFFCGFLRVHFLPACFHNRSFFLCVIHHNQVIQAVEISGTPHQQQKQSNDRRNQQRSGETALLASFRLLHRQENILDVIISDLADRHQQFHGSHLNPSFSSAVRSFFLVLCSIEATLLSEK